MHEATTRSKTRRRFLHTTGIAAAGTLLASSRAAKAKAAGSPGKTYRAAVIGRTGRGNYGHGLDLVFKNFPNIEIVAVADENPDGLQEAAQRTGAKARYASYAKMLRDEKPDLVAVAPRWADPHHDMVLAAAEVGAHIYLEKPMARSLAEADAMVDACERRGLKMAIAHQMHLAPVIEETQRQVENGVIGQLLEIRGRGKEDRRAGGEDLMVLGTHVMDLMRLFAGDPQWAWADVTAGGHAIGRDDVRDGNEGLGLLAGDTIMATYGFGNGVHGFFGSKHNAHGNGGRYGLDLYGSKGVITIRSGMDPTVHLFNAPSWAPPKDAAAWKRIEAKESKPKGDGFPAANARLVADLLDAIEHDRRPRSSGHDGRAALEMILAVYASQRAGTRVKLPIEDRRHPLEAWRRSAG